MTLVQLVEIQVLELNHDNHLTFIEILIIIWGLILLLRTSGWLVRSTISFVKEISFDEITNKKLIQYDTLSLPVSHKDKMTIRDYTGIIIGKCENILIYILIIFDQYTALALIFTAKTVVRAESIRTDPLYYLAGTMINVSYSIVIAVIIKYLIKII